MLKSIEGNNHLENTKMMFHAPIGKINYNKRKHGQKRRNQ
jgi:hypothetical protein